MLAILVNHAWDVKELLVVSVEIALSVWLLYDVEKVVWSAKT